MFYRTCPRGSSWILVLDTCLKNRKNQIYFFRTFNCWVFVYSAVSFRLQTTCLKTVHLWLGWSKLECSRAGTVMEHWQGTYVLKQRLVLVLDSSYFFRTFNCWVFCCLWCHVILSSDNSSKEISPMAWVEYVWMQQSWHSHGTLTSDLCFKTVPNTCVVFSWQLFFSWVKNVVVN